MVIFRKAELSTRSTRPSAGMQDPKTQRSVRQPELPKKGEPVQKQPANNRPIEGQGITKDERAQEPADKKRALRQIAVPMEGVDLAS
jgi:hypothetical protein